jgi:hypothetical protein
MAELASFAALDTWRVEGTSPSVKDLCLLAALLANGATGGPGGTRWRIAVRNEAGQVYRVVLIEGQGQARSLAALLNDLGFVERPGPEAALMFDCVATYWPAPYSTALHLK